MPLLRIEWEGLKSRVSQKTCQYRKLIRFREERLPMNKKDSIYFQALPFLRNTTALRKRNTLYIYAPFLFFLFFCFSCKNPADKNEEQVADFNVAKDYFPEKTQVKYAKGFNIRYFNNYKLVDVIGLFSNNTDTQHYVLVQRGTPVPKNINKLYTIIEIPIRSIVCLSSTHIALTTFLNANKLVIGVSDTNYIYNPEVKRRIRELQIKEIGKADALNTELIVAMKPDLLMTVGRADNKRGNYQSLITSGIKIIANSEWMEPTPLGRAEWVKLLAAFLNEEKLAEEKFTTIEQRYNALCALTKTVKTKPKVITGTSYKGIWFVPGGNTYMARFLKDAGADYYWAADTSRGSLQLNLEAVYPVALHADAWLNIGTASTRKEIEAQDNRFKLFNAFKTGRLYNCTKRANTDGSNDYWESGIINPHLVLADIINILHPGLLPDSVLTYYKKIE